MLTKTNITPSTNKWQLAEIICCVFAFSYFLFYPRDTVSDFIICSILCFSIISFGDKVGLIKPSTQALSAIDLVVVLLSITSFIAAWAYAYSQQQLNYQSILTSIVITTVYFYYAWIQHFLAQRYVALRMVNLANQSKALPKLSIEFKAAALTGAVFGILHIPYPHLMIPATIAGALYAFYFLITGRLWMVVSSHALVASSWLYWLNGANAFTEFPFLFSWI